MNEPGSWLAARLAEAPERLREAVQRAAGSGQLGGEGPGGGGVLRERAEALLAEAMTGPATPETAGCLLAADALMTLACEWTAEHEPEQLRD